MHELGKLLAAVRGARTHTRAHTCAHAISEQGSVLSGFPAARHGHRCGYSMRWRVASQEARLNDARDSAIAELRATLSTLSGAPTSQD